MALGQPLKPWILYEFWRIYVCYKMGWHYLNKTKYVLWVFIDFLTVEYIFSNLLIIIFSFIRMWVNTILVYLQYQILHVWCVNNIYFCPTQYKSLWWIQVTSPDPHFPLGGLECLDISICFVILSHTQLLTDNPRRCPFHWEYIRWCLHPS